METFYMNLMCMYVKHSIWNLIIFLADNDEEEEVKTSDKMAHDEPNEGMYEEGNKSNLLYKIFMVASKLHLASFAYAKLLLASFAWPKVAHCIFCLAACFAFYTIIISVSIIEPDVVCFPHVNMNLMENVKGWDKQGNKVQVIT